MKSSLVLALLLFLCVLVSHPELRADPPFATTDFSQAARRRGSEMFSEFTKFVVLLDQSGQPEKLYYIDMDHYEFHADFLRVFPEFKNLSQSELEKVTFADPHPKAYLGVLTTRGGDDGIYWSHFNLVTKELSDAVIIKKIHDLILKSAADEITGGDVQLEALPFQLDSLRKLAPEIRAQNIKIFEGSQISEAIPYTDAWGVGKLVWIGSEAELLQKTQSGELNADSILVTDQYLREFPPVAGYISAVPLTPASHAVLLAQMYQAPVVFYKKALALKKLAGQWIFLNAENPPNGGEFEKRVDLILNPAASDLKRLKALKVRKPMKVSLDLQTKSIVDAKTLSLKDIPAYGGKGSQLGLILKTIPENTVSKAMVISDSFSIDFFERAHASNGQTLRQFILQKLSSIKAGEESLAASSQILEQIRTEIQNAEIPKNLVKTIQQILSQAFLADGSDEVKLKFRSSSNVEDGAEFNGAGLYESKGGKLNLNSTDSLEKTLKFVWGSLYTDRGFIARRRFGVDEKMVGMGVAVHPPFKGELFNGVASLFIPGKESIGQIETQVISYSGEENQVTHANGTRPEIVRVHGEPAEVSLQQSAGGQFAARTLMTAAEYLKIDELLKKLVVFYKKAGEDTFIEIEWKGMPDQGTKTKIFVKQVRRIPKAEAPKLADGSNYLFLNEKELRFDRHNREVDAYTEFFKPKNLVVKFASATEKEIKNSQVQIEEVSFSISGTHFSIKNPKVVYQQQKNQDSSWSYLELALPNAILPNLKMQISLPEKPKRSVYSVFSADIGFSLMTSAADLKFLGDIVINDTVATAYIPNRFGDEISDFENDQVKGTGKYFLNSKNFSVAMEEVKESGEGDNLDRKIGKATLKGIFSRPLVLPATAIGYGANHHSGEESYIFDLLGDPSLTAAERKSLLSQKGRYLYLDANGNDVTNRALLVQAKGKLIDLGNWKESKTEAKIQAPRMVGGACRKVLLGN